MGNRKILSVLAVATSFVMGCVAEVGDEDVSTTEEVAPLAAVKLDGKRPPLNLEGLKLTPQEGALAPAPGITYFQTYAVISANASASWEYLSSSQFSTVADHGGAWIDVAVLEYGYGNGNATLNSAAAALRDTQYLCGPLSSLHVCNVGESVTGFMHYYEYINTSGGFFNAFSNSIAYPWGQWTDSVNIR